MTKQIIVEIDADLEAIIPGFIENRQKDIVNFKEFLNSSDIKSIEVIGHKLAGNAGSYGFDQLGKIGKEIELAAQQNSDNKLSILLEEYESYMTNLKIIYVEA